MTHSKSNRALSLVLSIVMMLSLSCVFCFDRAYAETDGLWQYTVSASGVEITGYAGNETSVSVPQTLAGKQVVSITGLYSTTKKGKVVSITLPSGLKNIKKDAFSGYTALERVSLPDNLVSIGSGAFENCTQLTGITIPSSVTLIGESAFANCPNLKTANLACGITDLPAHMFEGDKLLSVLTIAPYITSIGDQAFAGCSSLKSIVIPDTVKTIGKSAFQSCSGLTSLTLSSELKLISENAFNGCSGLTKVFVPNKIKTIGEAAFSNCSSLKEVYISPNISVINQSVFSGCTKLTTVVFGGEYVTISNIFDVASNPTVYYPTTRASSWSGYSDTKKESYAPTTSISVTGTTKLAQGDTSKLKIVVNPTSSKFSDIFSITSSNKGVATVTSDGTVTARGAGSATITVTDVNGTVGTAKITVTLPKPTNVTAVPKSTSSVELKWDDMSATGYNIYRATTKTGTYKKIDTAYTNSYTNKGLTKGKTYYYKVEAFLKSNNTEIKSPQTAAVSVKVSSPAPATVSATKTKKGVATVKWGKSTGANGYEVYMATSSSGKYSKIATITSGSTLSYKKTGLTAGKTYYFKVRSYITVNGTKVYSPYTKVVKVKV